MRMQPLSIPLASLAVCFVGVAAITAQDHPRCVAIAEQSPAARGALYQTKVEPPATVTIVGEVGEPCTVAFWEGMTLSDLITQAGRLNRTANLTPRGLPGDQNRGWRAPGNPGDSLHQGGLHLSREPRRRAHIRVLYPGIHLHGG